MMIAGIGMIVCLIIASVLQCWIINDFEKRIKHLESNIKDQIEFNKTLIKILEED